MWCATTSKRGEPVSSRSVARRHVEPLSPATVRNVMAELEEGGFLYQPHTSAGRVPTAAAYRFFVEQVAAQATASPEDRQWIRRELESAQTPEAVMERASHVLAAVSRGLGIFISPPLARSVVEHLRFLLLPDGRVLVVLVTTGGLTRDKLIRPERAFRQEDLDRIAALSEPPLRGLDAGSHARRPARAGGARPRAIWPHRRRCAAAVRSGVLGDSVGTQESMSKARRKSLRRSNSPNQDQLRELLEAIEEKDRLIALLSGCIESPEPVHVELGLDQMSDAGKHLALVSASYSTNDQVQGTLGILAPMRMHYERVITAVAFMAQFFSENSRGELIPCREHNDKEKKSRAIRRRTRMFRRAADSASGTVERELRRSGSTAIRCSTREDREASGRKAGTDEHAAAPPGGFRKLPQARRKRAPSGTPSRRRIADRADSSGARCVRPRASTVRRCGAADANIAKALN